MIEHYYDLHTALKIYSLILPIPVLISALCFFVYRRVKK